MPEGNYTLDSSQGPRVDFTELAAGQSIPIPDSGWYQIVVTKNAFIKIDWEGQDVTDVTALTGCDIFAGFADKWYVPKNGKIGIIGASGTGAGSFIFHKVGK